MSEVRLFQSVQTPSIFSSSIQDRIKVGLINWSEYLWSLPLSSSHVSYFGRVEQIDSSNNLSRVTYLACWAIFGYSLFATSMPTSLFLIGATLLPKIYHRNYNVNGVDLPSLQKACEKMVDKLPRGEAKSKGQFLLINYYLQMKNPEAAKKIISKEWDTPEKASLSKLPFFQYYFTMGAIDKALHILDDPDRENEPLMGKIELALVSYHLNNGEIDEAKNLINTMKNVPKVKANLLLGEYYHDTGAHTEEKNLFESILLVEDFLGIKAMCDYLLPYKCYSQIKDLLSTYYTLPDKSINQDKLTHAISYLIEIGRIDLAKTWIQNSTDPKVQVKLVEYYLGTNNHQGAIETLQILTNSPDSDVISLLGKLKKKVDPSLADKIKCVSEFIKYYLKDESTNHFTVINTILKDYSDSPLPFLEIVKFYIKENHPIKGVEFIRLNRPDLLDKAYLEVIKYYLKTKKLVDAEQTAKLISGESEKIEAAMLLLTHISRGELLSNLKWNPETLEEILFCNSSYESQVDYIDLFPYDLNNFFTLFQYYLDQGNSVKPRQLIEVLSKDDQLRATEWLKRNYPQVLP